MRPVIKICGLLTAEAIQAAIAGEATHLGFVFYSRSPRAVTPHEAASLLTHIDGGIKAVGLFVDPSDEMLAETLGGTKLHMLQLHGQETPVRVAEIRARFGKPVMKAVSIATAADLAAAHNYEDAADWLLFDAKPAIDGALPGGNGMHFDWSLLAGRRWRKPWMLSGGLNPANVAEAIRVTGARAVDVSSGVETAPGIKNPDLIVAFCAAAQAAGIGG